MAADNQTPSHFKGKDAIAHVAEAQVEGIIATAEIHGTETPGYLSAAADGMRNTALTLLILASFISHFHFMRSNSIEILSILALSWLVWFCGRSAWLGWARLERLHRVVAQEKWEIEHHRQQERDELKALYNAKGFTGKLLEDVVDVLMADGDRLLKVMVEEEMGLTLKSQDHPLKQALWAFCGSLIGAGLVILGYGILPSQGAAIGAAIAVTLGAISTAYHAGNQIIPACIWNLGLLALAYGTVVFLLQFFFPMALS